jgi:hypothetical protein
MMRLRRALVIATLSLLAWAATASAECAWVVWNQFNMQSWEPLSAFPDEARCRADIEKQLDRLVENYPGSSRAGHRVNVQTAQGNFSTRFNCLPDTVDPRGPKGR